MEESINPPGNPFIGVPYPVTWKLQRVGDPESHFKGIFAGLKALVRNAEAEGTTAAAELDGGLFFGDQSVKSAERQSRKSS